MSEAIYGVIIGTRRKRVSQTFLVLAPDEVAAKLKAMEYVDEDECSIRVTTAEEVLRGTDDGLIELDLE